MRQEDDVAEAALAEAEQAQRERVAVAAQAVLEQAGGPRAPGENLRGRGHAGAGRKRHGDIPSSERAAMTSALKISEIVSPSSSSGTASGSVSFSSASPLPSALRTVPMRSAKPGGGSIPMSRAPSSISRAKVARKTPKRSAKRNRRLGSRMAWAQNSMYS